VRCVRRGAGRRFQRRCEGVLRALCRALQHRLQLVAQLR
jgi:hypothetical protein